MKKLFLWTFAVTLLCCWTLAIAVDTPSVVKRVDQTMTKDQFRQESLARHQAVSATNVQPTMDKAEEQMQAPTSNMAPDAEREEAVVDDQSRLLLSSELTPEYMEMRERIKREASENRIPSKPADGVRLEGGEDCASAVAIGAIPYTDEGYTCDNTHEYNEVCPYSTPGSPDVVYSYEPAADIEVRMTLCLGITDYDTKLYVYQDLCPDEGNYYACNDDACTAPNYPSSYVSRIDCLWLYAGHVYYIVVDGYGASECGNYTLEITECLPCDVECPPDSYIEQELCGEDLNGGCNTDPVNPPLEAIECGMTVCGTGWADANFRDTDWYTFDLAQTSAVSWTVESEFPGQPIFFYSVTDCNVYEYDYALIDPCVPYTFEYILDAGTYWLWMGDQGFSGNPCGGDDDDYVFTLTCEPLTDAYACCYGPIDAPICEDLLENDCLAMENGTWYPGEYCATFDCPIGCVVQCPPDSYIEQEPCGDDTNGGCNTDPNNPPLEAIECNMTVCGTAWAENAFRDTDWYVYTLDQTSLVTWTMEAEFFAQPIFFTSNTNCNTYTYEIAYLDPCVPGEFQAVLPAGDHWLWMGDQSFYDNPCGGDDDDYVFTLTCEPLDQPFACCYGPLDDPICEDLLETECAQLGGTWYPGEYCATFDCPICVVEESGTAPIVDATGTTCGAGNDCDLRASEEVMWEVEIPNDGEWVFSLCGSDFDTYLYVGTSCCGQQVGYNDDFCGLQSQLQANITAGTYYVDIEAYGSSTCGNYVLNVYELEPCVVECPDGAQIEQEPCGEDLNGGCNTDPVDPPLEAISLGVPVCGTGWADANFRDTDWFELIVDQAGDLTVTGEAEFPLQLLVIYNTDCNNLQYEYTLVDPCVVGEVTLPVAAGPVWVWIGDQGFSGNPCGGDDDDYWFNTSMAACEQYVTVEIMTDNYPGETTWELYHAASGTLIGSGGPYSNPNTLHQHQVCVDDDPTGCYLFIIYDAFGDGICCDYGEGYYNVYDPSGALVCSGGEFGDLEECVFGECFGACCLDGDCIGDMNYMECADQGGVSYIGESCDDPEFECPTGPCDGAIYHNGDYDGVNGYACDRRAGGGLEAWVVDDVTFDSDGNVVTGMSWYCVTDETYVFEDTDDFILLEDDGGMPGAVILEEFDLPNWREDTGDILFGRTVYVYRIDLTALDIDLPAGTYWFGARPINQSTVGQNFWLTAPLTGSDAYFKSEYFGYPNWVPGFDVFGAEANVSFCLLGPTGAACEYVAGDANENMTPLELGDVVTMIAYYRGTDAPEYFCECGANPSYPPNASQDGNCIPFELGDVVTQICAYRGTCTAQGCPDCPPPGLIAPDSVMPTLKSKVKIIEKSNTQ